MRQQLEDCVAPHLHEGKLEGMTGEQDRLHNPGFQCREKKASKSLAVKPVGVVALGEIPSLTREFTGEAHRVIKCTKTHPPRNQHQKDPICLVGERGK